MGDISKPESMKRVEHYDNYNIRLLIEKPTSRDFCKFIQLTSAAISF